jgi:hypothetical protein
VNVLSRLSKVLFVAMILAIFAGLARADSIADPTIIIRDPACPGTCVSVGTTFTFGTPQSGTGTLFFTNASGVDWFNLKLVEAGVPSNAITCITDAFANCSLSTVNGITTIFLSGINTNFAGIPSGHNFSIVFGCASGKCDPWPGDLDFTGTANVPEPTSVALMVTGLGALVSKRKFWKRGRA